MKRLSTYPERACAAWRLVRIALAIVLAIGFVPVAGLAGMVGWAGSDRGVAYAAEDDNGEGEGGNVEDEAAQKEEADRAAAKVVEDLIDDLPSHIGVDDRDQIERAMNAYNDLTPDQQAYVGNVGKLEDALRALEQAEQEAQQQAEQEEADKAAAAKVDKEIGFLPAPKEVTKSDRGQFDYVRGLYDALTDAQKEYVTRLADLNAVEEALLAAEAEEDKFYVKTLLLKWEDPDEPGKSHFVGDSEIVEPSYRQINIAEFGERVQLRGWYLSTDGTGTAYQTGNSETHIGAFNLKWESSDDSVATVDPDGMVTPHGKNGTVTITATVIDPNVYQGSVPTATVTIKFDGQDGKYVKKVEILDETGKVVGKDWGGVTVYSEANTFHQLQARVTWYNVVDKTETVEVTGTGDSYDASNVDTTIVWNISDSAGLTINKDTGRVKTGKYSANAFVTCTAIGGLGGAEVSDSANMQLDTGTYEYNPANSLTLRVVWEERPDEVVKEATFSLDELSKKLSSHHVSATVVNSTKFGVISAEGYLFKDVVALVSVDDADVLQYRFGTADGYDNPVSYQYLFNSGNRYYFPNYDIGSKAEGEIVPPLLAYKSRFMWNMSEVDPNWSLDEGTRFRLVFGCLDSNDANTSFQIYYINSITIVLAGAPSAGGNGGGSKADSGTDGGAGGGQGGGKADGTGGKGHGKSGAGKGTTGTGGGNASGNLNGNNGDGRELAGAEEPSGEGDESSGGETDQDGQTAEASGTDINASKRWRVYQMMNKTNSDVPDWDDENPISPFAAPIAIGTFAVGAGATGIGFRRRLK